MTPEECRRILGVSADAGPEAIRQAYIDLARVWHPDRFQSDERLRRIAEEHFQQVSQAYTALKHRGPAQAASASRYAAEGATAAATEDPPDEPPQPVWRRNPRQAAGRPWIQWPVRPRLRWSWRLDRLGLPQVLLALILVAAPFAAAFELVPLLRVPEFDSSLIASRAFQPRILTPMSTIDTSSDLRTAADELTAWAAGDAVDLWKPAGTADAPRRVEHTAALAPAPRVHPEARRPAPPPPNGSELLEPVRGGAGELRLLNDSSLEAVVRLVRRNSAAMRAIYIAPNSAATIASIAVGVYDLDVDLGHDFDAEHLRFGSSRVTPAPLGPFQFAEITSDTGISGNRYDVVLKPR